jgi:hypothetical protein
MNFLLFCLSLIIVPHGITDIIVSYETNTIVTMFQIYSLIPILCMNINYLIYKYSFIGFALLHFRHDNTCNFIPNLIVINYIINNESYETSLTHIIYYLSFIHTPLHYYEVFSKIIHLYETLILIAIMTIISLLLTPYLYYWIEFHSGQDYLSKYVGGIIISHIVYNEYLDYSSK